MRRNAGEKAGISHTMPEIWGNKAKKLHFLDIAGVPYSDADREEAFEEVCGLYHDRSTKAAAAASLSAAF